MWGKCLAQWVQTNLGGDEVVTPLVVFEVGNVGGAGDVALFVDNEFRLADFCLLWSDHVRTPHNAGSGGIAKQRGIQEPLWW